MKGFTHQKNPSVQNYPPSEAIAWKSLILLKCTCPWARWCIDFTWFKVLLIHSAVSKRDLGQPVRILSTIKGGGRQWKRVNRSFLQRFQLAVLGTESPGANTLAHLQAWSCESPVPPLRPGGRMGPVAGRGLASLGFPLSDLLVACLCVANTLQLGCLQQGQKHRWAGQKHRWAGLNRYCMLSGLQGWLSECLGCVSQRWQPPSILCLTNMWAA